MHDVDPVGKKIYGDIIKVIKSIYTLNVIDVIHFRLNFNKYLIFLVNFGQNGGGDFGLDFGLDFIMTHEHSTPLKTIEKG